MRDSFIARLSALAERDPRIMLLTGDLGFGVFNDYRSRFPRQFLNVGVAEQNMIGLATGLALEGHVVFTYSIANFSFMRCLEQLRNDAAYHDCNVNAVCIGGGFSYGALGISHHATEDLSIMRSLPSISVVSPGDNWEASEATESLAQHPGVSYLRLDKTITETTQLPGEEFCLGKIRQIRDGKHITLAATGGILAEALEAARLLEQAGIAARVLSVHTIKPLDSNTLAKAAQETGGIVTIEEHTVDGGLGSAVAENLLEMGVTPRCFARVGLRAGFSSRVGSQEYLRAHYGLNATSIAQRTIELLHKQAVRRTPPLESAA